jgi:hypothetical protein
LLKQYVWTVGSSPFEEQKVVAMSEKPVCLVIMPFGSSGSHDKEYWDNHFARVIKPAIERATDGHTVLGYEAIRADSKNGDISDDVLQSLLNADVVVAVLTDISLNVMYELGIRHSVRGRTIMIIEKGLESTIPFYLRNYRAISYSPTDMHDFQVTIEQQLRTIHSVASYSDNPVSSYLHKTGQSIEFFTQQKWEQFQAQLQVKGFTTFYTREDNDKRNARKIEALKKANEHIYLIASSGYAYLEKFGNLFRRDLQERLRAKVPVQIILEHPFSDSRVQLTLGALLSDKSHLSPIQQTVQKQFQQAHFTGFDPVEFIEQSDHFTGKFQRSLAGFEELQRQFGDLIDLRVSRFPIPATILLTEKTGFCEPYIRAEARTDNRMTTFEIEFPGGHDFHLTCMNYFDFLWKTSLSYTEYKATLEFRKEKFRQTYAQTQTDPDGSAT